MNALATHYFPAGIAIGLGAAAPIGPINLLVLERALRGQRLAALMLGLGAALGDGSFAVVAGFGIAAISALVREYDTAIRIIGGLVMLGFALIVWRSAPVQVEKDQPRGRERLALMSFSMTVTNPATLFFFIGSFSAIGFMGLGHDTAAHRFNAGMLVGGAFLGSMLWWLLLTGVASHWHGRVSDAHLRLLNHGTAVVLALFGIGAALLGATGR